MKTINIIGSGISKVIVNKFVGDKYRLNKHYLSISPNSLICENEAVKDCGFENKNEEAAVEDIEKSIFEGCACDDILIVDLLDCRLNVVKFKINEQNYTSTKCNGLDLLLKNVKYETLEEIDPFEISEQEWKDIFEKYVSLIKKKYKPENVIVIEAKSVIDCIYKNNKMKHLVNYSYGQKCSRFYDKIYTIFKLIASDFNYVPCPDVLYCEASEYRPFSFYISNLYYEYAEKAVVDIIENKGQEVKNLLNECNNKLFERIRLVDTSERVWKDVELLNFVGHYEDEFGNVINNNGGPVNIYLKGEKNKLSIGKGTTFKTSKILLTKNNLVEIGSNNKFENNSLIEVILDNELKICNDNVFGENFNIIIKSNSIFELENNNTFHSNLYFCTANKTIVKIKSRNEFYPSSRFNIFRDTKLLIGNSNFFNSGFHASCHAFTETIIKNKTIWAQEIVIVNGDGHSIFNIETKQKINDMKTVSIDKKSIIINDHVWVGKRAMLLNGTNIGEGSIVGAGSVVKKSYPNNCVVAGVPAKVVKRNVCWCRDNDAEDIDMCFPYVEMTDDNWKYVDWNKFLTQNNNLKLDKLVELDIWGSCVSRELFNFDSTIKVGKFILQNPINTIFEKGYELSEDKVLGTSNFTKRMAGLDFAKTSENYFNENFKTKYLMIDFTDCKNNIYRLEEDKETAFCGSESIEKTFKSLKEESNLNVVIDSPFDISDEQWEDYAEKFCSIIKQKYQEDHIILHEVDFASSYIDQEGNLVQYPKKQLYSRMDDLVKKINEIIKKKMPNCLVLKSIKNPLAYENHKLGNYTLHYVDEYYHAQNLLLKSLLGIIDISYEEAENYYKSSIKKYFK